MGPLFPASVYKVVAIDGKTARGSRQVGQRAIHLVSGYGSDLGQIRNARKTIEITAIPELFDALLLKGAIVTIDAMGCQHVIADKIVQAGADYVLACKGKQGAMRGGIKKCLRRWSGYPRFMPTAIESTLRSTKVNWDESVFRECDWLATQVRAMAGTAFNPMLDSAREIGGITFPACSRCINDKKVLISPTRDFFEPQVVRASKIGGGFRPALSTWPFSVR